MVSNEGLKVGDVVQIAVQLVDDHGRPYWWRRFAVVRRLIGNRAFESVNLKMNPNLDQNDWRQCDVRTIHYGTDAKERPQVVTKLREPWPQGVAAMHMKYVTLGIIALE